MIGPDYVFSIVEILAINAIMGYFLYTIDRKHHPVLYLAGLAVLILQNTSFITLVMANPGLPSRDTSIHSQAYLNKVRILK